MKKFVSILLTCIMVFGLVGCGSESASTTTTNEGNGEAETIKIAVITNTTGDYSMYGLPVHNSFIMYLDEVNAAGGINGKQIEYFEYDDKADGVESVNAYRLAKEQGVTAVLGSVLTGATIALADATYEDNMPQITPSATNPGVTLLDVEAGAEGGVRENVFRTCFLDPFQGQKMTEYAKSELGAKTYAIFYEQASDYSEAILNEVEATAEANGLTQVAKEAFSTGDKDYKAQMTNIAAANPDVIFMPIYYGEAGLAITALRAAGCTAQVVGGDGFGAVKDYASAEDLEGTVYFSGYAPGTDSVKDYENNYFSRYNVTEVNMFGPLAYDAAMVMCKGIEAAEEQGLTPGSDEYKQAIIDTIDAMDNVQGITGAYTFNETNDPVKSVAVIECTGGQEVFKNFF